SFLRPSMMASWAAYPNNVSMRMMPSEVVRAKALLVFVVSIYRLSKILPPSVYQFSRGGVARRPAARVRGGAPRGVDGPRARVPPGGVAVASAPTVAGQARSAAPELLELTSAMAAALWAEAVSGVCAEAS